MPRETSPAFIRTVQTLLHVPVLAGYLDGTGAITFIDSLPIDYRCTLEKITFVFNTPATGTSASQIFNVRKGGPSGTIVGSITLLLGDGTAIGKFKEAKVTAANDEAAKFKDGDTLSFTRDSSGTAFTAGTGTFFVTFRQRAQARI